MAQETDEPSNGANEWICGCMKQYSICPCTKQAGYHMLELDEMVD